MSWWVIILLVLGVSLVTLIIGYIWASRKKTEPGEVDRIALLRSEKERYRKEMEAERAAKQKAENIARQLAKEKKKINEWYNAAKESIEEGARHEYDHLSTNQAALDAELDRLLDIAPADDPGPNNNSQEGKTEEG